MGLFTRGSQQTTAPANPADGVGLTAGPKAADVPRPQAALAPLQPAPSIAPPPRPAPQMAPIVNERTVHFDQLKVRIHQQLVERLDVQNLRSLPPDTVRAEVRVVIKELCQSERSLLSSQEQERLMDEVMDETFGLGPLEVLLKDPTITDILVNRFD